MESTAPFKKVLPVTLISSCFNFTNTNNIAYNKDYNKDYK